MRKFFQVVALCIGIVACHQDDPQSKNDMVPIDRGTPSITISVLSKADSKMIPVVIAIPDGATQPLKAVVVMHGSGGLWQDEDTNHDGLADICDSNELAPQFTQWKNLLLSNGMVAAFPDSYAPRGTCENENQYKDPPYKFIISGTFIRNSDAIAVLELLRRLVWSDTKTPVIDGDNVAILGFSDGGTAAISTLYDTHATPPDWIWKQSFNGQTYTTEILPPQERPVSGGYKTGVWYYAGAFHNSYYGSLCTSGKGIYKSYCDVLVHLPDEDPLTDNAECLIATMLQNGGGFATVYHYPGTGHSFDGTKEPESTLARTRTIDYLKSKLGI